MTEDPTYVAKPHLGRINLSLFDLGQKNERWVKMIFVEIALQTVGIADRIFPV